MENQNAKNIKEEISKGAEKINKGMHEAAEGVKQSAQDARKHMEDYFSESIAYIKKRPVKTVLIAVGIGLLLGRIL